MDGKNQENKGGVKSAFVWFKKNYLPIIAMVVIVMLAFILISPLFENLVGDPAPDFLVTSIEGERISLSENLGKVVVLNLMSTTCPACKSEMEHLKAVYDRYSMGEVVIITIDIQSGDSNTELAEFKSRYGDNWTFARDTDDVANKYNVNYTPTTVVIDKKGVIRYYGTGELSEQKLIQEIERLI